MSATILEPHTAIECDNGALAIVLSEIKAMMLQASIGEDQSCLTVRMKDGSETILVGPREQLHSLGDQLNTQSIVYAKVVLPQVRYAVLPGLNVTIDNEEGRR